MYAPKFRSWLTDDERFAEAQEWRINLAAEAALQEIREMAKAAMVPEPDARSQEVSLLSQLYNLQREADLAQAEAQMRNLAISQFPYQLPFSAYQASGRSTELGLGLASLVGLGGWRNP
jgi:hypothetical protein